MAIEEIIEAIAAHEALQWKIADAVLADAGSPPKTLAECSRFIAKNGINELRAAYPALERPRQWAEYWRAAAAFPNKESRPKDISSAIKAGDPLTYWVARDCVRRGYLGARKLNAEVYSAARKTVDACPADKREAILKAAIRANQAGESSDN